MPQSLGSSLRPFVKDKQSAIAQRWLELWKERTGAEPDWKLDTIVGHLSRCLNDKVHGTPFFADPARAEVLFDALDVPSEQREGLRKLAAQPSREPEPRLVVDITRWPDKGEAIDALFSQLREKVLGHAALAPVALVLTETQYDRVPRSYDDLPRPPQLHRVPADQGPSRACELAGTSGVLLSPWAVTLVDRWIAADFDGRTLKLAPEDGLSVVAAHGELPDVPEIQHSLDAITAPSNTDHKVSRMSAVERRAWIYALADEAALAPLLRSRPNLEDPAERLAFARQLDVPATSRASERLEHELARLAAEVSSSSGLPVEKLGAAAHAQRLARAAERPTPASVWRVDDALHLLHVEPPREHPRLVVHRPTPPQPALARLLEHIADWTTDDYDSDPSLLHAISQMDADQRRALLHARATLLWNKQLPPPRRAQQIDDWARELRALLATDPPEADLHLPETPPSYYSQSGDNPGRAFFSVDLADAAVFSALPKKTSHSILFAPARTNLMLSREQPALLVTFREHLSSFELKKDNNGRYRLWRLCREHWGATYQESVPWQDIPTVWLPKVGDSPELIDRWLDFHERSAWADWTWDDVSRSHELLRSLGERKVELLDPVLLNRQNIDVDDATWEQADTTLSQCWMALRSAMRDPIAVRLPSGIVHLSLGAGMSARLEVSERRGALHGEPEGTITAALEGSIDAGKQVTAGLAFTSLWTHDAKVGSYKAQLGVRVPARLIIRGPRVRVDIRFVVSPLLYGLPTTHLASLTAIAASLADDERAAAEQMD